MKCYISSIACCFQLGPLKNRWKSGQQGVLELGNLCRRGALAVWEIQSEGGKNYCHPSGGVYFFWNYPFFLILFKKLVVELIMLVSRKKKITRDFLEQFLEALKSVLEVHVFSKKLWIYFSADRKRTEFFKKAEAGCEDWSTDENRELLRFVSFYPTIAFQNCLYLSMCFGLFCHFRAMMMTACDLSAITKPWPVQRRVRD